MCGRADWAQGGPGQDWRWEVRLPGGRSVPGVGMSDQVQPRVCAGLVQGSRMRVPLALVRVEDCSADMYKKKKHLAGRS